MNDLISRKDALCFNASQSIKIDDTLYVPYIDWYSYLSNLPPAQPQIIRCDDCKNYHKDECPMRHVEWIIDGYDSSDEIINDYAIDDGFCYMGDR